MGHWWRRAYPGHVREGCPPVALVLTGASAKTLNNRAAMICDLAAEFWRGHRRTEGYSTDSWFYYSDSVPTLVAPLDKLAELGPMGEVWWRYGRDGLHSLTDALDVDRGSHGMSVRARSPDTPTAARQVRRYTEVVARIIEDTAAGAARGAGQKSAGEGA
ncbi:hypothetical protein ACFC6L_17525 [Kitasatospora phosalacinea]|uniref:hypothetical protein n=1 Tax=Kitasatospora phosalacinea TaxID=2065 RepID=UPI0035DAF375